MSDATLTTPVGKPVVNPTQWARNTNRALIAMRNIWKNYQMGTEAGTHAGVSFDVHNGHTSPSRTFGFGQVDITEFDGCSITVPGEYWLTAERPEWTTTN